MPTEQSQGEGTVPKGREWETHSQTPSPSSKAFRGGTESDFGWGLQQLISVFLTQGPVKAAQP